MPNKKQKSIERSYQRAMNLRDASPTQPTEAQEQTYTVSYLKAYRTSNPREFRQATRLYLKQLRGKA